MCEPYRGTLTLAGADTPVDLDHLVVAATVPTVASFPTQMRGCVAYSAEFKLSVTKALADQMALALDSLTPEPLSMRAIDALERRPGVYQLYYAGELVYIGSAERSLPQRLERHLTKLQGRLNICISHVSFTCLYVDEDFSALAPENSLIKRFKSEGRAPWNFGGFGSNDPGAHRDTTVYPDDHFDVLYPVDLDIPAVGVPAGTYTGAGLVVLIKAALPYLFRYATTGKRPRAELGSVNVVVPEDDLPADRLFTLLAQALPAWQITALPGYVIMYPERRSYPSARRIYTHQSNSGTQA